MGFLCAGIIRGYSSQLPQTTCWLALGTTQSKAMLCLFKPSVLGRNQQLAIAAALSIAGAGHNDARTAYDAQTPRRKRC